MAVLELLSPANKQNPGRTEYLSKRNAILRQNVHLVELDLLLGGERLPLLKSLPLDDYYYLLKRVRNSGGIARFSTGACPPNCRGCPYHYVRLMRM